MFRLVRQAAPFTRQLRPVAEIASAHKLSTGTSPRICRDRTQPDELTPREKEVLYWVASGKRNREIGLILGISARTVQKHVQNILNKLNVETRSAATAVWFREMTRVA